MMTIEDIKKKKKEFGYSNQQIAKKSGVPLGTVNKIFSGMTKVPRYETLLALEKVFRPVLTPEDPDSYAPKYAAPHPYQFARLHRDDSAIAEAAPAYAYSRKRDNDLPVEQVAERWPNQGNYTVEDYFNLPDDIRAELIDGRFYIMNAPSYIHQEILGQLYVQFQDCIRKHPGRCRVYFSPMNVQLDGDDRTMVQPDLIVICEMDKLKRNVLFGAPDLAVEVMSPSSRSHDAILKLDKYINAGVKEYWLVDPLFRTVTVYRIGEEITVKLYRFEDRIPVGISGGKCEIDFKRIAEELTIFEDTE